MAELMTYIERHPWWTLIYLITVLSTLEAVTAIRAATKR